MNDRKKGRGNPRDRNALARPYNKMFSEDFIGRKMQNRRNEDEDEDEQHEYD